MACLKVVKGGTPSKSPDWDIINLNQVSGVKVNVNSTLDPGLIELGLKWLIGPGLKKEFGVKDGWWWDGGRGERRVLWKEVAVQVPM